MSKRKHTDLSLAERYNIVKLLDQKLPQIEISKKLGVSTSQISRINAKKEEIRLQYECNSNPQRKRQRTGKSSEVKAALKTWFNEARTKDIPLSGPVLEEKAKDLAQALNKTDFVPTAGWLSRWKTRNDIVYKRQHGEKKDADYDLADHWMTNVLPELLLSYKPEDIYNADETGIYYRAHPDGTLTEKKVEISGGKKMKDRVTALVACNMSGSDKRRLLVIRKSKDLRCFRGVKNLPVIYRNNKNLWMTADIFTEWLQTFDRDMRRQNRNILLLVDNCSAHPQSAAD